MQVRVVPSAVPDDRPAQVVLPRELFGFCMGGRRGPAGLELSPLVQVALGVGYRVPLV